MKGRDVLCVLLLVVLQLSIRGSSTRSISSKSEGKLTNGAIAVLQLTRRDASEGSFNGEMAIERSSSRLGQVLQTLEGGVKAAYQSPLYVGRGAFMTTLSIGTPGVSFNGVVDTGSDLVWRQCKPCSYCFEQTSPVFDPSSSSTYSMASCSSSLCSALPLSTCNNKTKSCHYGYLYGDLSFTEGELSYDTLNLLDTSGQTQSTPGFAFGCGNNNQGNFLSMEGIIGFGQGPLSLPTQISAQAFSYCLLPYDSPSQETSPLFLGTSGGFASGAQSMSILTNKLSQMKVFYYLPLLDISVGGKSVGIPSGTFDIRSDGSGGMIIDSGTTLTYLVDSAYRPLIAALSSSISSPKIEGPLELCYESLPSNVPEIVFHFEGANYNIPPANLFIDVRSTKCVAFVSSGDVGQISIFGNIQQQNYHILYDTANKKLSFMPTSCANI